MARGFNSSKRPINSNKNSTLKTSIGVAAGVLDVFKFAATTNDYTGVATDVPIGSSLNSFFIHVNIQPQAAVGVIDWYLAKVKNSEIGNLPVPGAVGGAIMRNKIFHEEHGLPGVFNNGASPNATKMVFVVPKRFRRMSEDDIWVIQARCSTAYDYCAQVIYKFYQ